MTRVTKENLNYAQGRMYANYILKTNDSQYVTAKKFCVSPSTVRRYINCLEDSPIESDKELYNQVHKIKKSRRWGYSCLKA